MSLTQDAPLHDVVDQAAITKLIEGTADHAALHETWLDPKLDADYLHIGCEK